jgi:hypothetical protein
MSQPVRGYLRFYFELSACAHRNVGAGTQVTGNPTTQELRAVLWENRVFHHGSVLGGAPNTNRTEGAKRKRGTLHASCTTGNLNNRPSDPITLLLFEIQPTTSPVTRQIRG